MTALVTTEQLTTGELVAAAARGELGYAGEAGGRPWSAAQAALLFASLEAGWPVGQLLAWSARRNTPRRQLLDGHRRVSALMSLLPGAGTPLVRDCSTDPPRYLPAAEATPGGRYLPVDSMLATMRFLAATSSWPQADPPRKQALHAAHRLAEARIEIVLVSGGDAAAVAELCRRLLPGRVDPAVLTSLHAGSAAAHDTSGEVSELLGQ